MKTNSKCPCHVLSELLQVLAALPPKEGPEKCTVHLKLPWIGNISTRFENQGKTAVSSYFGAVKLRVVFFTRKMLSTVRKNVVPTKQQSMVVYQYVCSCDCRYVGRTSQRLQDRIKQHIPKAMRNHTQSDRDLFQSNPTSISAIGQHLLNNEKCISYYSDNQFSILAKRRTLFHLSTLEATLIKSLKPVLCRQKEFVYTLKLHHRFGLDETFVVNRLKRSNIFTNFNRYKYLAINLQKKMQVYR